MPSHSTNGPWRSVRRGSAPTIRISQTINEKVFGPNHPAVAGSLNNLGLFYQNQGHYADAEPLLKQALAIWEKAYDVPATSGWSGPRAFSSIASARL
jgi:hypothetical protein